MTQQPPEAGIAGRFRLSGVNGPPPPLKPLAALDSRTGRACEVWLVPPEIIGVDYGELGMAAAKFAGLRHLSLQDLLGVFREPGGPGDYWVYEAPPGKSFAALAAEVRPFSEAEAADIAVSLSGALKKVHGVRPGSFHGGISPHNIYLAGDGRAVLGGVKPFELGAREESPYDPPGEPRSQAADLYSLGASLAFLLTGKDPTWFRGNGGYGATAGGGAGQRFRL